MLRFAALLLMLSATALASAQQFTIIGHIVSLPDQWLLLSYMNDSLQTKIDSAYTKNGKFQFNGNIKEPTAGALFSSSGQVSANFFFEAGETSISGDLHQPEKWNISGGKSTKDYEEFIRLNKMWNQRFDELKTTAFAYGADSVNFQKHWQQYTEALQQAAAQKRQWLRQHRNETLSAYLLLYYYIDAERLSEGDSLMSEMSTAVQQSKYARSRSQARYAVTLREVGKPVKDFSQTDTAGNLVSTKDFRGHYYLLDFWASWCKPCRDQSPALVAAYRRYHPYGFDIVSVSLDHVKKSWIDAIRKDSLDWTHLSELKANNSAAALYDVHALPANFLVDEQGTIIDEYIWGERLQARLEEIYGK